MLTRADGWGVPSMGRVLIVDDDRDICDLVHAILTDDGFSVSMLHHQSSDALRAVVNQLEPDCVLLDGASPGNYGSSWEDAAWITRRDRPIPVMMFTAHRAAIEEAEAGQSERSRDAQFSAILSKPFDLDRLLEAVAQAVGHVQPFDSSETGDRQRTAALVERLEASGATDIHPSTRREWASFVTPAGAFLQLYWWQRDGVYYLVRFALTGGRLETLGRFYDLGAAISVAMTIDPDSQAVPARAGVWGRGDGLASPQPNGHAADGLASLEPLSRSPDGATGLQPLSRSPDGATSADGLGQLRGGTTSPQALGQPRDGATGAHTVGQLREGAAGPPVLEQLLDGAADGTGQHAPATYPVEHAAD
jgi:CheY-like chemotaxis protein